jgi:hypothetical protein
MIVERLTKRREVLPALLLNVWGGRERRQLPSEPVVPCSQAVDCTPVLPWAVWVKAEVVIVAARDKLAACQR